MRFNARRENGGHADLNQKIEPRHGVITLFGYGISVRVDRGHLLVEDGIGADRRSARFPRVGHGLKRVVTIGTDGMISLAALRWLSDQDGAFVMLDRIGKVLVTAGSVKPSDARLRRAQSLAHHSGLALPIAKELIRQKLIQQEVLVRKYFPNSASDEIFEDTRAQLEEASSSDEIRLWEAQAARAYWTAWRELPISFPRRDLPRVPDHWKKFGSRISPLTSSPRLAVNPPNALLNYLYALLESEARLALAALGLDPGIGVLHNDLRTRDSLACDLMDPIRPNVDEFLLEWLRRTPIRREWFFEQRDGNCRLMADLAGQLSETATIWRRFLAPFAEGIARSLWEGIAHKKINRGPATRLTQSMKRDARGFSFPKPIKANPTLNKLCLICGKVIKSSDKYCRNCVPAVSRENLLEAAKLGRIATHMPEAEALRAATQRRQVAARKAWNLKDKPDWLDEEAYGQKVQPQLRDVTVVTIMKALHVSEPYATNIRSGRVEPHPRHWLALAELAGIPSVS
jgi:CRISPR-associated endonuclease Cas1